MSENIEHCEQCDEATGNSGRGEDSLFYFSDKRGYEIGPLCQECYDELVENEE